MDDYRQIAVGRLQGLIDQQREQIRGIEAAGGQAPSGLITQISACQRQREFLRTCTTFPRVEVSEADMYGLLTIVMLEAVDYLSFSEDSLEVMLKDLGITKAK